MSKKYQEKSKIKRIRDDQYLEKRELLTSFFLDDAYPKLTMKQLATVLQVPKEEQYILDEMITDLEQEGFLYVDDSKRYVVCEKEHIYKCVYQAKTAKFGFGILDEQDDIYITRKESMGAMNGDEVLVKIILDEQHTAKSREGQVIRILKRNTKVIVGRYTKNRNFGFVEPIDTKMDDIYIPKKYASHVPDGKVVEVEILKYATPNSKAEGKIIQIIGDENTPNIEVKALYQSYGLDTLESFGALVEKQLKEIPQEVRSQDKMGRIDATKERVVTIDGDDAKDLDDGVCVKKLENGNYVLSVFIADVSHYVIDGSPIDKQAVSRGTSIYIPGTVLPMLPKALSNGICSLNAGVERLALAIDMIVDPQGNMVDHHIYKAVIQVKKRMSYHKVYEVLTHGDPAVIAEYKDFEKDLFLMQELALLLNKKRLQEGSINFDIPDTQIVLDEKGNVCDIKPYEITIANKIIEEFMLAANRTVAEQFFFLNVPFIYRVHEKPDDEKIRELNEVLANYHKRIKGSHIHPKALSQILEEITEEEEKKVVSTCMLRTLKLARYSEECLGHFGLAAKYYCHFTSPIRRYPDLFIHRVISDYITHDGVLTDSSEAKYAKQAILYAKSSSDTEKEATLIERDFDNLYEAMYMKAFIGEEMEAHISSVTSFGMFVKLDNTVEGLVPFEAMPGTEYFEFVEDKHMLVGRSSGTTYRIGDKVQVRLIRCDVKSRQLDFEIV